MTTETGKLPAKWRELAADSIGSPNPVVHTAARAHQDCADELEQALARDRAAQGEGVVRVYVEGSFLTLTEWLDGARDLPDGDHTLYTRPPVAGDAHPDDVAVDKFAAAMKAKLADARAKGRGGWDDDEDLQQHLSNLLRGHVEKGDPRDVANFCCFLWNRGEGIAPPAGDAQVRLEAAERTVEALRIDLADAIGTRKQVQAELRQIKAEAGDAQARVADADLIARMLDTYAGTTTAHANGDSVEAKALALRLTAAIQEKLAGYGVGKPVIDPPIVPGHKPYG